MPHGSVVRVVNAAGNSRWYGSGTLVQADAQRGIILTCGHLFSRGAGTVAVTFPDARSCDARVLAVDRTWDLAALAIVQPAAAPVRIAAESPQPGEPLASCGYGSDGRYGCNQGRALGYVRTAAGASYETLELSGSARDGDSGGPVFNQQGELVAVLWGTDGRMVSGTYCGRIRKFLAGILAHGNPPQPQPSPDPLAPASPLQPQSPVQGNSSDAIHKRLDGLAASLQDAHRRLGSQEESLGQRMQQAIELAAALKGRVEKAEAVVGGENLRAVVRDVAVGVIADKGPGLAAALLPGLLAALGWTGPPAVAAILAIRLAAALVKRRVQQRSQAGTDAGGGQAKAAKPLNDDYAGQLARVFALSGRSPLGDVTLGREYDEELRRAAGSSDAVLARWARELRDRVAQRFFRIHGESPLPAEPVSSGT